MPIEDINITDLVDGFLKRRAIEDDDRDNSHFHPSEFSGCKRKIAYKYYAQAGIIQVDMSKMKIRPTTERIFGNGHHVHYRWGGYLSDSRCARNLLKGHWKCANSYAHEYAWKLNGSKNKKENCHPRIYGSGSKLGCLIPTEKCECGCSDFQYVEIGFLNEDTMLGGHIDALILWPTGDHVILDYKSANRRIFSQIGNKPKPEHFFQIQCYLYLSGLKYGKLIYECKDDQSVKEIDIERDDVVIDQIINDARLLKEIVTNRKSNGKYGLPPRSTSLNPEYDEANGREVKNYVKTMAECYRCPFRPHCWSKP